MSPSNKSGLPYWSLALPLIAITAEIFGKPEHRLWAAVLSASIYTALQWLLPKCRFRPEYYFSPINFAMVMMLLKLVVAPSCAIVLGPDSPVLTFLPSNSSMNAALLIDTVAYIALCIGLTLTPDADPSHRITLPTPSKGIILSYIAIGLIGFIAVFGSFGRIVDYFLEPKAISEIAQAQQQTVAGLAGTFLRPFLAFSLVAWWSRILDRGKPVLKLTIAGLLASFIITLANLTYSFNRAAFLFPLLALAAIYHNRLQKIPIMVLLLGGALGLPALSMIFTYRSNMMVGRETETGNALLDVTTKFNENLQGYAVGPHYTGLFYERIGWGDQLYWGSTLLSSALSPIPVLGKAFRGENGPSLYNRALYGIDGFQDQILPFDAELFANFHAVGVIVGYIAVGFLLGKLDFWILASGTSFTAFTFQYAGIWTAMLTIWSLSIYAQILIYFFGPVYVYVALVHLRQWLRRIAHPNLAVNTTWEPAK